MIDDTAQLVENTAHSCICEILEIFLMPFLVDYQLSRADNVIRS